jgi:hypothetical protein
MKKTSKKRPTRPTRRKMSAEYDFSGGVRGKHAKRFAQGTNVVLLAPDVAAEFKTSRAVNAALRKLLRERKAGKRKSAPKARTA